MRIVYQRVRRAAVTADGEPAGAIEQGALLLLGVGENDTEEDADLLAQKIAVLRVFEDENGRMNRSLADINGACLVVSNFTLYGDCRRGRRPDFTSAGAPGRAKELYEYFASRLSALDVPTACGVFGAEMTIDMVADGPVTLILDSEQLKAPRRT